MNRINFNQPGGFPLDTDILSEMQSTYTPLLNGLGAMAGERAILSGCIESGNNVSAGFVQIGSEILEFRAGIKQNTIIISEEITPVEFENGENKPTVYKRFAAFGSGVNSYNWADFQRVIKLNTVESLLTDITARLTVLEQMSAPVKTGSGLIMFNDIAANIPAGFEEVPEAEWRGRIPVHINRADPDFNEVGKTGGSKTHTITVAELPPHSHNIKGQDNSASPKGSAANEVANIENPGSGADYFSRQTTATGGGAEMNIMNPYRVVIFIRWKVDKITK